MSSLLHAKRTLERRIGAPIELRRYNLDGEGPVEAHAAEPLVEWHGLTRVDSTLLGSGVDPWEAIDSAHERIDALHKAAARESRGDDLYEEMQERSFRGWA